MQRYFVAADQIGATGVTLSGDDARHLAAVMRAEPGDRFVACDGSGRDVLAEVTAAGKDEVRATIVEELEPQAEMRWRVTVAQSLPKGDKLETVIQKGTEAGAFAFVPFVSSRTVVQYDERKEGKRLERWRKIAKEAAEQSHRSRIPDVANVAAWPALLARFGDYDLVLFCYEEEGRAGGGLQAVLDGASAMGKLSANSRLLVVIGPEGGFGEREADAALAAGAHWTGLGKRILRTETSALYALACLAYASGELGGKRDA